MKTYGCWETVAHDAARLMHHPLFFFPSLSLWQQTCECLDVCASAAKDDASLPPFRLTRSRRKWRAGSWRLAQERRKLKLAPPLASRLWKRSSECFVCGHARVLEEEAVCARPTTCLAPSVACTFVKRDDLRIKFMTSLHLCCLSSLFV